MSFRPSVPDKSSSAVQKVGTRRNRSLQPHLHQTRISRQFRQLTDSILQEFSTGTGGTIVFTGIGSSRHVADVAEHVARQISLQLETSTVGLVDGNIETQILTERFAGSEKPGLAEILQRRSAVASTLYDTGISGVRFLPFGDRREARNPIMASAVTATLSELKQLCHYTVVAIGTAHHKLHAMLSRYSHGTYLIVQLGAASHQDIAEVSGFLNRAGARLLGCIATGAV